MSRRNGLARAAAALLLPWLAVGLACSLPSGVPPTPNTATQAVATRIAATDAASPVVDPCSFMTTAEATALAGTLAAAPKPLPGGGCIYYDTTITNTGVGLYVLPANHAQGFLGQYVPAFRGNGVPIDQTLAVKLTDDTDAGDMPAAVNDLAALVHDVPNYEIQQPAGVGSAAMFSWRVIDTISEGVLMAAQPGALVVMILHGTLDIQETPTREAMAVILNRSLARLPRNFTVPGLP